MLYLSSLACLASFVRFEFELTTVLFRVRLGVSFGSLFPSGACCWRSWSRGGVIAHTSPFERVNLTCDTRKFGVIVCYTSLLLSKCNMRFFFSP